MAKAMRAGGPWAWRGIAPARCSSPTMSATRSGGWRPPTTRSAACLSVAPRLGQARADDAVDDVLRALLLPFEEALLPRMEGVRVLMLNARASPALPPAARGWRLQQDFRPHADALSRDGFESTPELPAGEFDIVLLPAP